MSTETAAPSKAVSTAAWKKAKVHNITLPSGVTVDITLPNLPEMIKSGSFPNNLLPVAIKQVTESEIDAEKIAELADYHRFLVQVMVVKPELTLEDVKDLPSQDIDMLVALANRERDMDAVGHHLAGLETHEGFRTFRGLSDGDEGLLG